MENRKRRNSFTRIRRFTRSLMRNMEAELRGLRAIAFDIVSNWKKKPLTSLTAAVIAALFGWGGVSLYNLHPIQDGGQLAAWVQAVGSVGAIVVAVVVGMLSANAAARNQLIAEKRQRLRIEDGYKEVISCHEAMLRTIFLIIENSKVDSLIEDWQFFLSPQLNRSYLSVNSLPLHDFGNKDRINNVSLLQDLTKNIITIIERLSQMKSREIEYETAKQNGSFKKLEGQLGDIMRNFYATYEHNPSHS